MKLGGGGSLACVFACVSECVCACVSVVKDVGLEILVSQSNSNKPGLCVFA